MNPDPLVLLRSRGYVRLLVLAALIGVPVSAAAYGFLELVTWLEDQLFTELPDTLGFASTPAPRSGPRARAAAHSHGTGAARAGRVACVPSACAAAAPRASSGLGDAAGAGPGDHRTLDAALDPDRRFL